MRNKFKILVGVFLLTISGIAYVSCNDEETTCETCNVNSQSAKLEFINKSFDITRNIDSDYNYVNLIKKMKSNEVEYFYTLLEQKFNLKLNNIVATTIFTNKIEINKNNDYNIDFNDISGFITYVKDDTNTLKLKVYKFEKNKIIEGKLSNTLSDRISIKDQNKIGLIEFSKNSKTIITFYISSQLPKNKSIRSNIKDKIEEMISSSSNSLAFKIKPDEDTCENCGEAKTYGECDLDKTCDDAPCTSEEAERKLKSVGINNYNFVQIREDLHNFRDLYLKSHTGGDKIIKTYYKLSQKLPIEDMTIAQCIKTFDLIVSDIVPLTNKILNSPQSNEILIDQATNQKIIIFLSEVKQIFPDMDSKNRVDNLINKINHFSNKSNKFISDNLNDF